MRRELSSLPVKTVSVIGANNGSISTVNAGRFHPALAGLRAVVIATDPQTVDRIKGGPRGAEAALAAWGLARPGATRRR
jgi:hypothetical protein